MAFVKDDMKTVDENFWSIRIQRTYVRVIRIDNVEISFAKKM